MPVARVLLIRLREIGDVVFTTPAVHALRERFPSAHFTYIVEPAAAPVVAGNPHIDEVIVAPHQGGVRQLLNDLALGRELRRRRFDVAIDFHGGPRASLLTWLSRAPVRVGYEIAGRSWAYTVKVRRARELRPRHSVVNQWDLLEPLGVASTEATRYAVEMTANPAVRDRTDARLADAGVSRDHALIVVHVSAGNPFRRWPISAFAALVSSLVAGDVRRRVIVSSGPSEAAAASEVIATARQRLDERLRNRVVDAGEFTLEELRVLLDRAALYIGGDSGPLHIAATTAVPIVGLYGPTLPARSAPWRGAGQIAEAVEVQGLECRPCDQRVCAPGDFRCLLRITPEQVLDAAERALARAAAAKMSGGS